MSGGVFYHMGEQPGFAQSVEWAYGDPGVSTMSVGDRVWFETVHDQGTGVVLGIYPFMEYPIHVEYIGPHGKRHGRYRPWEFKSVRRVQ